MHLDYYVKVLVSLPLHTNAVNHIIKYIQNNILGLMCWRFLAVLEGYRIRLRYLSNVLFIYHLLFLLRWCLLQIFKKQIISKPLRRQSLDFSFRHWSNWLLRRVTGKCLCGQANTTVLIHCDHLDITSRVHNKYYNGKSQIHFEEITVLCDTYVLGILIMREHVKIRMILWRKGIARENVWNTREGWDLSSNKYKLPIRISYLGAGQPNI